MGAPGKGRESNQEAWLPLLLVVEMLTLELTVFWLCQSFRVLEMLDVPVGRHGMNPV